MGAEQGLMLGPAPCGAGRLYYWRLMALIAPQAPCLPPPCRVQVT